jgi:hypothetical protein
MFFGDFNLNFEQRKEAPDTFFHAFHSFAFAGLGCYTFAPREKGKKFSPVFTGDRAGVLRHGVLLKRICDNTAYRHRKREGVRPHALSMKKSRHQFLKNMHPTQQSCLAEDMRNILGGMDEVIMS